MVIELADVHELAVDPEANGLELEFPDPVVRQQGPGQRFVHLHRAMDGPASSLERESALTAWLQDVAAQSALAGRRTSQRAGAERPGDPSGL